jgi:phosphosulfolactate phosphohydrolase-like enzyme
VFYTSRLAYILRQKPVHLLISCVRNRSTCLYHASETGPLAYVLRQKPVHLLISCVRNRPTCLYHASETGPLAYIMRQKPVHLLISCVTNRSTCLYHASQTSRHVYMHPSETSQTASVINWSEFLLTDPEVLVRFPALLHFLRSSRSGTGSTQSRE